MIAGQATDSGGARCVQGHCARCPTSSMTVLQKALTRPASNRGADFPLCRTRPQSGHAAPHMVAGPLTGNNTTQVLSTGTAVDGVKRARFRNVQPASGIPPPAVVRDRRTRRRDRSDAVRREAPQRNVGRAFLHPIYAHGCRKSLRRITTRVRFPVG